MLYCSKGYHMKKEAKREQFYATLEGLINSSEYKNFTSLEKNIIIGGQKFDLAIYIMNDSYFTESDNGDLSCNEIYLINYGKLGLDDSKIVEMVLKEYHKVTYINIPEEHHFLALGGLYRLFVGFYDPDCHGELLKICKAKTVAQEGFELC